MAAISPTYLTGLSFCTSGGSLFFFLRPASFLDIAMEPQFNHIQYDQSILFTFPKASMSCYKIQGKKVNRQRAALGFHPSHEVLQALLGIEHCRPLSDQDKETNSHERSI